MTPPGWAPPVSAAPGGIGGELGIGCAEGIGTTEDVGALWSLVAGATVWTGNKSMGTEAAAEGQAEFGAAADAPNGSATVSSSVGFRGSDSAVAAGNTEGTGSLAAAKAGVESGPAAVPAGDGACGAESGGVRESALAGTTVACDVAGGMATADGVPIATGGATPGPSMSKFAAVMAGLVSAVAEVDKSARAEIAAMLINDGDDSADACGSVVTGGVADWLPG